MASSGKKKSGKKSWKPVATESVIDASVKKSSHGNWADEVDQALQDEPNDYVPHKNVVLPTAPRASRASNFDESQIPHVPPFQVHVSNVPYELEEHELVDFFEGLQINSVRLPKEEGKKKGYGYVEFDNRESLIAALNKPDTVIKGRTIKIDLSNGDRGRPRMDGRGGNRDGGMRGGDMGGPDRTAGNWRSGPGPRDDYDAPMERGGGGGGGGAYRAGGGRDFSSSSGGGSGFRSGGFDREERGGGGGGGGGGFGGYREERGGGGGGNFREDRDRGFDRGGGGFDRDRGDRGFSRGDDRRRDDFDRGFGGRDDRGGGSSFNRDNRGGGGGFSRDRGFDDDHREERGGGGGSWRDDSRGGNFNKFEERRDRDREPRGDRGYGPPMSRREDSGPPMQERATERKKLNLIPRSSALPVSDKPPVAAVSSSIFGGAKPVDTRAREREVEERLNRGDEMPERSRSGPGSTTSSKDYQEREEQEKAAEAPQPPRENVWLKKPTSPVVNNGRTTPDGPSGDERVEGQRSWGRGEPRRPEPRRTGDNPDQDLMDDHRERSNRPPPKSGPPSSGTDKGRPRDERQNKSREPRKDHNVDDHKMPQMVENKPPNFMAANKFNPLDGDEAAE